MENVPPQLHDTLLVDIAKFYKIQRISSINIYIYIYILLLLLLLMFAFSRAYSFH